MRKIFAKILIIGLALGLISNSALAAGSHIIRFVGGKQGFVFSTVTKQRTSDELFDSFKDMMPGDARTETFELRNDAEEYEVVKFFLRADTDDEDFLSAMRVEIRDSEDNLLYSSVATGMNDLDSDVLLGDFEEGDRRELSVTMIAGEDLDSRFMHYSSEVAWVFTAECYGEGELVARPSTDSSDISEEDTPDGPNTFDGILKPFLIFLIALLFLWLVILWWRKREREQVAKRRNSR